MTVSQVHSRFIDNILQNEKNWKVHLLQDCLEYPGLYCLQRNFKNFFFKFLWTSVLVCVHAWLNEQTEAYRVMVLEHTYSSGITTTEELMILSFCVSEILGRTLRFEKRDYTFKGSFLKTHIKLKKWFQNIKSGVSGLNISNSRFLFIIKIQLMKNCLKTMFLRKTTLLTYGCHSLGKCYIS